MLNLSSISKLVTIECFNLLFQCTVFVILIRTSQEERPEFRLC